MKTKKITIEQVAEVIKTAKNLLDQGKPPTKSLHFLLKKNYWYRYKGIRHFEEFCLSCLGCRVEALQSIYQDDQQTLGLITQALRIKHQGWNTELYPVPGFKYRPAGNSRDAALRKLKKHRPDLYEQVINKEISAHAAMIEAGFRKKKVTVGLDPADAIDYLVKNFSIDQLVEIYREVIEQKKNEK